MELAGSILQAVGVGFMLLRLGSAIWRLRRQRGHHPQAFAFILLCGFDLLAAFLIPLFSAERSLANLAALALIFISPSFLGWALAGELQYSKPLPEQPSASAFTCGWRGRRRTG